MKRVMLSLFVILFLFSPLVFAVDLPDAPSMPVVDSGLVGSSYTWLWVALGFVALGVIFYFLYNYFSKKLSLVNQVTQL